MDGCNSRCIFYTCFTGFLQSKVWAKGESYCVCMSGREECLKSGIAELGTHLAFSAICCWDFLLQYFSLELCIILYLLLTHSFQLPPSRSSFPGDYPPFLPSFFTPLPLRSQLTFIALCLLPLLQVGFPSGFSLLQSAPHPTHARQEYRKLLSIKTRLWFICPSIVDPG